MQAKRYLSPGRALALLVFPLLLAGCFGEGEGPQRIPGTPAPPPPPPGSCDAINFEESCPPVSFLNFGGTATGAGGVSSVINNPDPSGINTSERVGQMQKFSGEPFAGSSVLLNELIDFADGEAFTMKVWASRSVPVLFKLEDAVSGDPNLGKERTASHSGSGAWEEVCLDFSGAVNGFSSDRITLIFDIGVVGAAETNPNAWTFYFDDIAQVDSCGGGGGDPVNLPVDFEADPATYDFGAEAGFGGGVATVIANPDQSGLNTTAQTARMQKFAGEVFGGATLALSDTIDFADGEVFKMKVWATREVPVLFKLEDAVTGLPENGKESFVSHSGSVTWEELCFDFSGNLAGFSSDSITFIFDLGVAGDAENNPQDWTFYFDQIEQVASCDGGGGADPGIVPEVVIFSSSAEPDLVFGVDYTGFEPFGSGSTFDNNVTTDPDFSPAFGVTTGNGYGAQVGQFAIVGFQAGFASGFGTLDFKAKGLNNNLIRVKFLDDGAYIDINLATSDYSTALGNGWYQVTVPITDFTGVATATALLFETDNTAASAFTFLLTDFGFSGTAGGGGGECDPVGAELATNGDFERGDLSCWEAITNGGSITADNTENNTADGTWSAHVVTAGASNPTLKQNFLAAGTVATGDVVNVSFDMKGSAAAGGVIFPKLISEGESGSDGPILETIAVPTADWTTYSYSSTITADVSRGITFEIAVVCGAVEGCTADVFIDNVSIQIADDGGTGGTPPPPVDFEGPGPFTFADFEGGVATVIDNPVPGGINTSAQVGRMQKFAGATFGGSTLVLPEPVAFVAGEAYTMKVWSPRPVPVLFKLEGVGQERTAQHGGTGWELLCFDFTGTTGGNLVTGITLIFDNGTAGAAATDPDNWTFYFDDIEQAAGCDTGGGGGDVFDTITFDDPDITYTLTDFGGNASVVTNDPAGGTNQVAQVVKTAGAQVWAGTTVSTGENQSVPVIPFDADNTRMSVRVFSPDAGIPVRLKVEDASNDAITVETEATTTVVNTWETLVFDFANQVTGTAALNPANTYNKVSIFFNFGVDGTTAGEKIYHFDDIAFGGDDGGSGGAGIIPEAVVYATDPAVVEDLAPPALDNFGSGAVFNAEFALDPDFNPAFEVVSGEGYGLGTHVGFVAFLGYPAGFAADFGTMEFKAKVNAPGSATAFEVKFFGGGDNGNVYDLTTYAGSTELGNGWYQVQIPMSDFAANIEAQNGFLMGPLGGQAGPFTMLLTDIGFSGSAGGGSGNCDPVGAELATNGDFEAGDLSCWEAITNGGSITADNTENNTAGGTWSAHVVTAGASNPTLKLNFLAAGTVAIGDVVDISFDMKGVASAGGVIFPKLISEGATGSDGPILETIAVPTAGWTTYTYSPSIVADVTRGITFEISVVCGAVAGCTADVFVDNVSVQIR
jgi:hypothetical protein